MAALAPAARAVGGPAIRNMASVGGNLFAPAPYGDFAVALLALDATVAIGGKDVPIEQFLASRETSAGIVTVGRASTCPAGSFRFLKVARVKPKGVSVLSIAAVLCTRHGRCRDVGPHRARLHGRPADPSQGRREGAAWPQAHQGRHRAGARRPRAKASRPITDAIASAWYRAEVLPVHLGRLLLA